MKKEKNSDNKASTSLNTNKNTDEKSLENEYISYEVDFKKVNTKKMSLQEIENIKAEIEKVHVNFINIIDEIDIAAENYRVLLILGDSDLIYDTGEFYIGETLRPEIKKKISRKQAQSIFVDYYVRHHINADIREKIESKVVVKNSPEKSEKVKEVKGIAAEILNKRKEEIEKNKVVEKQSVEEQIELM